MAEARIITPEPDHLDDKPEPPALAVTRPSPRKKVLRDHSGTQSLDGMELVPVAGHGDGSEQASEDGKMRMAKRR